VFDETGGTPPSSGARVLVVAGIANPDPFMDALRDAGWTIAASRVYGDHHPYSRGDVSHFFDAARAARADAVLTTEKDFVRLRPYRPFPMPVGWAPLTMEPEPPDEFRRWLVQAVAAARDSIIG